MFTLSCFLHIYIILLFCPHFFFNDYTLSQPSKLQTQKKWHPIPSNPLIPLSQRFFPYHFFIFLLLLWAGIDQHLPWIWIIWIYLYLLVCVDFVWFLRGKQKNYWEGRKLLKFRKNEKKRAESWLPNNQGFNLQWVSQK